MTFALKVLLLIALASFMFVTTLQFVARISTVAIIVIGAIFFTYFMYPIVRKLNEKLPLAGSIAIVYTTLIAAVSVVAYLVIPALIDDVRLLVANGPQIVNHVSDFFQHPTNPFVAHLPLGFRQYLAKLPAELLVLIQRYAFDSASRAIALLLSAVSILATVIVIPVLSVYLMLEAEDIKRGLAGMIPRRGRKELLVVLHDVDAVFGGFIRGQVLVGATVGSLITIMLLIMHVRYAVLIGVAAGVLDIIPYIGAVAGFVPAVSLAWIDDGAVHALIVAALFAAIFQLEGHFIAPKIVSDSVGLSPLWVIIAILTGGELMGIGGMFIAVPVAGIINVLMKHFVPKWAGPDPNPVVTDQPRDVEQPEHLAMSEAAAITKT